MIILPGEHSPKAIYIGRRQVKTVYVGSKLVWPEADLYGFQSVGICKTHAAFVLKDGTLWTTGSNRHGQLCRVGPSGSWNTPNLVQVPGINDAKMVAVSNTPEGEGSTVVLRENGRAWSAGLSTSPELAVSSSDKIAYTSLGRASESGSETFSNFAEILGIHSIQKIRHGRGRLIVQRRDGSLLGYGLNWDANKALFQWMPLNDTIGDPLVCNDLCLQTKGMVALRDGGTVSLLGLLADWHRPSEFSVSQTNLLQPYPDESFLTGIRKISTGLSHLAAVTENGFVHVAGSDRFGQLCSPKFQYRNPRQGFLLDDEQVIDVACGDNHTVILCRDGRVKTAGRNHCGQLGRAVPVGNGHDWLYFTGKDRVSELGWFGNCDYVPGIEEAVKVYAGGDSTMVVGKNGIHVFGDNEFGQLGTVTQKHVLNSMDRASWRESWLGTRTPFETNVTRSEIFYEQI